MTGKMQENGVPWGHQNRGKIDSGTLLGRPVAPKSVPGATQVRLGSATGVPGSARRVPKNVLVKTKDTFGWPRGARERTEAIKIDAESPPGAKKSSFFCMAGPRRSVGPIFRRF